MLLVSITNVFVIEQAQDNMTQQALSPQHADLQNAFQAFNEMSQQLADSYRVLEDKVVHLDQKLVTANNDRLRELTEKERVADRLQSLLKALPAGVIVLDNDGIVIECNPAAIDLLGSPLVGLAWIDIIHRAFAPRSDDGHDISLRDGRKVSLSTQALGGEPGQILLLQDVTETRVLQDSLNRSKRLSDMGEMAASLAHQIRTPLSSALLYSSPLLGKEISRDKRVHFTTRIRSSLQQLENQVNDMLMFAKGGGTASTEQIVVAEFLVEVKQSMEMQCQQREAVLEIECADHSMNILGTRESLLGAFQNLISNALNAGGDKVELKLQAKAIEHDGLPMIALSVQDNGPGISDENQQKIFEPFFTTGSRGTGLGLAVVKAVAHAHKGVITVNSTENIGSTFTMILPRQKANSDGFTKTIINQARDCAGIEVA